MSGNGGNSSNDSSGVQNSSNSTQEGNQVTSSKQGFGSKMLNGAGKAKGAYDSYKANGGLGGMAKNAINNKINDKKDQLKGAAKDKMKGMVPESVKKKQEALKGKTDALKNKLNKPKEKINEAKQKLNEKVFKNGVKAAVNALAPGAGTAAEKMLDTPMGAPALDAARNASDPISGLKEGTKKLVEIIVKGQTKKQIAIFLGPTIFMILIIIIVFMVILPHEDQATYVGIGSAGAGNRGTSAVDVVYQKFYTLIDEVATSDRTMIIATLSAQKSSDFYTDVEKNNIKANIDLIAQAITNSGNDVSKGDYYNYVAGSNEYFWWLWNIFVEDYYSDKFTDDMTQEKRNQKKIEIIDSIYNLYKELKKGNIPGDCTSGDEAVRLTSFDDAAVGAPIDASKMSVNEKGWKFYEYNGKKYLAVAAATNICINTGCGETAYGSGVPNYTKYDYITYYDYFDTLTLVIEGEVYESIVIDSCGACQYEQSVRKDTTPQRFDIYVQDSTASATIPDYAIIRGSDCTVSGNQIKLGNTGIYNELIVPLGVDLKYTAVSSWYYRDNGDFHGAIDITDNGMEFDKIPIIAAHSGVVTYYVNENCNSYSKNSANRYGLSYSPTCKGKALQVTIQDSSSPYNGYVFLYYHLSTISNGIAKGSTIQKGQVLGYMGNTGNSTGAHLHFEIRDKSGTELNMDSIFKEIQKMYGMG